LKKLVAHIKTNAQVAGPDHQWRLELPDEPIVITGDPYRLHEVVTNLLSNARIHTPAGTTITLAMTADAADAVQIEVRDDGPGIPAEIQPTVFERFTRADDSRSHANGSTGLGLAIVAAVVTAHGGAATMQSRPGQTIMTVRLPRDQRPRG